MLNILHFWLMEVGRIVQQMLCVLIDQSFSKMLHFLGMLTQFRGVQRSKCSDIVIPCVVVFWRWCFFSGVRFWATYDLVHADDSASFWDVLRHDAQGANRAAVFYCDIT